MNLPKSFEDRMKIILKDDYSSFIKTFESDDFYTAIRLNPKKENTKKLFDNIIKPTQQITWCSDGFYIDKKDFSGNHPYHLAGLCYFQEPSAMSSVEAMPINHDDFVLDLCAAPGGKSTQAGAKLSQDGLLISNEIIPKRATILAENIERFGLSNTIVTNESPEKLSDKFREFFDKIIVDAPCSGEGMFKKEPKAIQEWSENHTKTCAIRQKHILDCAYKMLLPGGMIVYSTCTFAPVENEGVVDYMLTTYTDLELYKTPLDMLSSGNGEWVNSSFDLSPTKRIFPHLHHGEGHFVAVLKKAGDKPQRVIKTQKEDKNTKDAQMLFKEFEKKFLNTNIFGHFKMFGENLYLIPHGIDLDKLKVSRGGFHLGIIKKNRFEPSHALVLALKYEDFKQIVNYSCDDLELLKYLHGETIESNITGYCAIMVDKNPIGWAKGSGGVLKNHYPKHLRLL